MHPYQTGGANGQTFDPALAKASPQAPVQPWGLQQIFTPQTSGNVMQQLLQGQNPYASILNLGK